MNTLPIIGGIYSPDKNGAYMNKELIKEDKDFYYFSGGTKYPKDLPFWWFKSKNKIEKEDEPTIFKYSDYNDWAKQIFKSQSIKEIKKVITECEFLSNKYSMQHLEAIQKTTSMQSNSQRRAQTGNNVKGNFEKKVAYKQALELHINFSEYLTNEE